MQGLVGGQEVEKRPQRLLEQVREAIRVKHYAIGTEKAYLSWIRRYIKNEPVKVHLIATR